MQRGPSGWLEGRGGVAGRECPVQASISESWVTFSGVVRSRRNTLFGLRKFRLPTAVMDFTVQPMVGGQPPAASVAVNLTALVCDLYN